MGATSKWSIPALPRPFNGRVSALATRAITPLPRGRLKGRFTCSRNPRNCPRGEGKRPALETKRRGPIAAVLSNGWSRLIFIRDRSRRAYAVAEVWNGAAWQRVASLYPLASLVAAGPEGTPETYVFKAKAFEEENGRLTVAGALERKDREPWPIRLEFGVGAAAPRIAMSALVRAPTEANLLAFRGPIVLAGDRAFGAAKDFAIFPGLEYLRGDEPSSSERDLAYPLSDRRVPATHKIATPLMAVQAEGALVALLWDAEHAWAKGEERPAARFLAPAADSGQEYVHMGLFAPSVGPYVKENSFLADTPYVMRSGTSATLAMHLVLDHEARYASSSVVHGPHEGGLVLQAMQHWFDVYGFPAPFPQPRSWDSERDLCRAAYLGAVWSDDPVGWRHCAGWPAPVACGPRRAATG